MAPKKARLKEAEGELAVAMKVRSLLQVEGAGSSGVQVFMLNEK